MCDWMKWEKYSSPIFFNILFLLLYVSLALKCVLDYVRCICVFSFIYSTFLFPHCFHCFVFVLIVLICRQNYTRSHTTKCIHYTMHMHEWIEYIVCSQSQYFFSLFIFQFTQARTNYFRGLCNVWFTSYN